MERILPHVMEGGTLTRRYCMILLKYVILNCDGGSSDFQVLFGRDWLSP